MTQSETSERLIQFYPTLDSRREELESLFRNVQTPVFVGARSILADRYRALEESLKRHWGPGQIAYSFKTNYLVAQSGIIGDLQGWAEVVSAHEYRMARELGFMGPQIVFNGPHKPRSVLRDAIKQGSLVHVNDHDELDQIRRLASELKKHIPLGIRLSTDLPKGGLSRFGFSVEHGEAQAAIAKIEQSEHLELISTHTHLYGDTDDPEHYRATAVQLGKFFEEHVANYQTRLRFLDVGGGFPAHSPQPKSRDTWNPQPIDAYVQHIVDGLGDYFPDPRQRPTLIVEPGRYLTCDAIVLVTRVLHVKERSDCQVVNCDGSISMVPLTYYCPQILRAYTAQWQPRATEALPSRIHGSTCRENDLLWDGIFPRVQRGDYLVHFAAGAYNSSLCPDFIFPRPDLVWI